MSRASRTNDKFVHVGTIEDAYRHKIYVYRPSQRTMERYSRAHNVYICHVHDEIWCMHRIQLFDSNELVASTDDMSDSAFLSLGFQTATAVLMQSLR